MAQLVDHTFDCGNITVLRSRVQFSFLPLFYLMVMWFITCEVGMVPLGIWLDWLESTWNPPGIWLDWDPGGSKWIWWEWWEFGGNLVGMIPSPGQIWVGFHWHDIPTKFLPFLPFHLDSARIRVECPGQGKVLPSSSTQIKDSSSGKHFKTPKL